MASPARSSTAQKDQLLIFSLHGHKLRLLLGVLPALLLVLSVTGRAYAWPDAAWAGADKTIVIGGDRNFPPYEFLDKNGQPTGFNVELSRAIAEVMGMEVEFRLGTWGDARKGLEDGSIDILQGITYSDARSKTLDFSPPHNIVHTSIFARRGAPSISGLEALRGKEVIVQKGGSMHDFLLTHDYGAKLILVDTHAAALRLLASGKHDYAMVGNLPGLYLGRELGLSNIVPVGEVAGGYYGYGVKKGNLEVLSRFSEGLAILKNTGRYQKIYDKWLGVLEPQQIPFEKIAKYFAMVVVPLLLILGVTVVWSRTLQKRVAMATAELQQRQQQLIQADKMASLGILVSGVAHEINNPTGLILLNLPVLKKAYLAAGENLEERFEEHGDFMIGGLRYSILREETPRMFDEMQEGARRIKRIVDDLKDFARKDDSGDLNESVDLNAVVHASVRLVENSIKKATRRFEIACADCIPPVRGNAQRIEQVVVNLILNACQALPSPEKGIVVATSFDPQEQEVRFSVRDEGVGIPKEHLSHLTDPFFTTKRDSGGTGLGLSVSAGIVKDHRGRLEFNSEQGAGTTVTMALPASAS